MKSALTTAFVLTACVSFAQAPGPRADLVRTTLPLEGAPKAIPGPYKVMSEPALGSPGHVVFRPEDLGRFPGKDKLPVMAWGDGGCAINSARYSGFFTTIASHGFLVIGSVPEPGAAPRQQNADDLRKAIAWAEKENARDGSPLKGKVDLEHVAVMGQSCGGFLSITLGSDPRVKTIGVFNSGVQRARPESNEDALQKVHGPVLLINGAERDFLTPASLTTFELIKNVPAFYGARHGAGHTATVDHPGGGEYANVASNWLLWQFKNDKKAAAMFVGDQCELCTNSNWDVRAKGYKDARNEGPSGTFDRGSSQQAWQNAHYKTTLSQCKNPPQPFAIPSAENAATATAAPPDPALPPHDVDSRSAGGGTELEGRLVVARQQRRRPDRGRERHDAVREQRRGRRHPVRSGDRPCEGRLRQHQYRGRRLAQQERRAVCRRTRTRRRHRAARAAAPDAREHVQRRAA